MPTIVPFYAALLAIVFVILSVRTIRLRRRLRIALGDAGNPTILRAIRTHSNFAEYVPMTLLLILMLELQGAHPALVHLLGLCLLVGRVLHAFGVSRDKEDYRFRVGGMTLTFGALLGAALCLLLRNALHVVA